MEWERAGKSMAQTVQEIPEERVKEDRGKTVWLYGKEERFLLMSNSVFAEKIKGRWIQRGKATMTYAEKYVMEHI